MADGQGKRVESVGTEDYADVTDANRFVVIAMGAQWCGPWRAFLPTFADVAGALGNTDMTFVTCDLERNPAIALMENITRIPSVIIYCDGKRVDSRVGVMSAAELVLAVSSVLDAVMGDLLSASADADELPDGTGGS